MFRIGETYFIDALNDKFDDAYSDSVELQDKHMEYIMENCHGERVICNGDMLIEACEDGYLYEAFRENYIKENFLVR